MRESTPTGETTDTVNAVTCYNYWRMSTVLTDTEVAPATPSGTAAYATGKAKDQLLTEQRFEYSGSSVTHVTGTVYRYGTQVGSWHRNALSEKRMIRSKYLGEVEEAPDRRKLHDRTDRSTYHNFMFQATLTAFWDNYADDSGNAKTLDIRHAGRVVAARRRLRYRGDAARQGRADRGRFDEQYSYDWFGRLEVRTHAGCTEACGTCASEAMDACGPSCAEDITDMVAYGYDPGHDAGRCAAGSLRDPFAFGESRRVQGDGFSNQVVSELGKAVKWPGDPPVCEPWFDDCLHATYTPGLFGNLMRTARNRGTDDSPSTDVQIEPLFDGMMNNVGAAWGTGTLNTDFEQTTAFGQMLTESGTGGPVAELGSFAWRGREGTISYRYNTDVGHSNLFRMVHRPYDPTTGRFTESHRDILAGLGPLAANRYIYVEGDPVNRTDPLGFHNIKGAVIVGLIVGAIIATVIGMYIAAIKYQAATTFRSADPMMGVDLRGNDGRMEAVEEVMDEAIRMPGTFSSGSRGNPPTTLPSACKKLIGTPESPEE